MIYSKATVMPIFDRGTTDLTDNNRDILHLELFKKLNVPVVVMTNASFQSLPSIPGLYGVVLRISLQPFGNV
jgi:hypothetical protein